MTQKLNIGRTDGRVLKEEVARLVAQYIEEANEAEDPGREFDLQSRVKDFALFLQHKD